MDGQTPAATQTFFLTGFFLNMKYCQWLKLANLDMIGANILKQKKSYFERCIANVVYVKGIYVQMYVFKQVISSFYLDVM